MKVLLSGASGLIGSRLREDLTADGHEVAQLVRVEPDGAQTFFWDPYAGELDTSALDGVDAVVNLSGAPIGEGRWTDARKRVLYDSRVVTTRFLAERLADLDRKPEVLVSQSAIGIYGDRGDEELSEESSPGPADDFLAAVTVDWEHAADPARAAGIRVVHPRTGLVLEPGTQLLGRLVPLFKAGLGGSLGDGSQWWSWTTLAEVSRAVRFLIDRDECAGPYNLVAPQPVRQSDFTRALARALHRPALLPVPRFALEAVLGSDRADALALSSTRAVPRRLLEAGYDFDDADLGVVLEGLLAR